MSGTDDQNRPATEQDHEEKRRQIADVEEKVDAESDGEGLAAEAGRGEETGLAEG